MSDDDGDRAIRFVQGLSCQVVDAKLITPGVCLTEPINPLTALITRTEAWMDVRLLGGVVRFA